MSNEIKLKLESNEFSAMYEIVIDICMKYSGRLYEADNFEKIFSPFILCRYISMKYQLKDYANILNHINSTAKLSKKQFYIFALKIEDARVFKMNDEKQNSQSPKITYDTDGVMLWDGKRCESVPASPEEIAEMEDLLSEFE